MTDQPKLSVCEIVRACAPDHFAAISDSELEREAQARIAAARAVWPNLSVSDGDFAEYLAVRSAAGALPPLAHAADLLLACACVTGEREAKAAFHHLYEPAVTRVLRRRGADASSIDDIKHAVFEKLLLSTSEERPRVSEYRGVGSLKSWVGAVAVTSLLMSRRSQQRRNETASDTDSLAERLIESGPELRYLKQRYRKPVEAAIVAALSKLTDRDRVLLRLQLCERMSIDRLGTMYNVNRSTAARWLASARAALIRTTHAEISRTLGVSDSECASILQLVQSQLDVSVARHLGA